MLTIRSEIYLILGPSVKEIAELAAIIKPAAFILCPLLEPYQLD